MLYVRGMMLMVRKAGMALLMLFQSIWAALIIMREPVRISAGPVQYTGMDAAQTDNLVNHMVSFSGSEDQVWASQESCIACCA